MITNLTTGRGYVGRKYVWKTRRGKITDQSDWPDYWGSSAELTADINAIGKEHFRREIIEWCVSAGETNWREEHHQHRLEVLTAKLPDGSPAFYNRSIANRLFARTVQSYADPDYREKQSKRMKAAIERNGHPMKGKPHPCRGKKYAPGRLGTKGRKMITDGQVTRIVDVTTADFVMPAGWSFGRAPRQLPSK